MLLWYNQQHSFHHTDTMAYIFFMLHLDPHVLLTFWIYIVFFSISALLLFVCVCGCLLKSLGCNLVSVCMINYDCSHFPLSLTLTSSISHFDLHLFGYSIKCMRQKQIIRIKWRQQQENRLLRILFLRFDIFKYACMCVCLCVETLRKPSRKSWKKSFISLCRKISPPPSPSPR